jgi:hypothetical protein
MTIPHRWDIKHTHTHLIGAHCVHIRVFQDTSLASSGPPPTPSEYSTGPGQDGLRGSPSRAPATPGLLTPMGRILSSRNLQL